MRFIPLFVSRPLALGALWTALNVLQASAGYAQPWLPWGSDFQINSETADIQALPTVARAADGRSAVAWTTIRPPLPGSDFATFLVVSRGFGADGTPFGPDGEVSAFQGGSPDLAASASGDFLLIWHSLEFNAEEAFIDVVGRRLDAAGQPDGAEVTINESTEGLQFFGRTGARNDGSFVVAWQSIAPSTNGYDIGARFVDATGQPSGSEFAVNSQTAGDQTVPDVAVASDGGFLVVWQSSESSGTDQSGISIQGRLFDSDGTALGDDFQINTQTTGDQTLPAVAVLDDDRYAVMWQSADLSPDRIKGQILTSSGAPVGGELTVPGGEVPQARPAIAAAPGGLLVAWETLDSNGDAEDLFAQAFDLDGQTVGATFQLNSYEPLNQSFVVLAADAAGDILAVWDSFGSPENDDDGTSILARELRYVLFEDGFESGDLSAWSSAVP